MLIALLLLLQATGSPCEPPGNPPGAPALVVQVVDPVREAIPGATVMVTPHKGKLGSRKVFTDREGYARIWLPLETKYDIEVTLSGFKRKLIREVGIGKASATTGTVYVQVQLSIESHSTTVW